MPFDNANEYLPKYVQVLLAMDRLLSDESKWWQVDAYGPGEVGKQPMCLFYGALTDARRMVGLEYLGSSMHTEERKALERLVPDRYRSGQKFNDAPETTFSDIKALLQEAIELESAKVTA